MLNVATAWRSATVRDADAEESGRGTSLISFKIIIVSCSYACCPWVTDRGETMEWLLGRCSLYIPMAQALQALLILIVFRKKYDSIAPGPPGPVDWVTATFWYLSKFLLVSVIDQANPSSVCSSGR